MQYRQLKRLSVIFNCFRFSDKIPENLPDFPYESTGATAFTESTFVISDFLSEGIIQLNLTDLSLPQQTPGGAVI